MERGPGASEAAPTAAALFAWGANSYGQLGLGHKEDVLLPQQLSVFCRPESVRKITGGGGHSAVVTDEGSLFVCGLNKDGQLGLGHTEDVLCFTPCSSLLGCPIQQVACGWDFTILLTASGILFQWGTGLASSGRRLCPGQTLPLFLTAKEPSRVTGLGNSRAIGVFAGSGHSASLTDAGELYVWGSNKHGQLASPAAFLPEPWKIETRCFQNEKVTAVWSGWTHLVAQTETGKVFTWGRADYGQLGRKLESQEGRELQKQDSSLSSSPPQKSSPSPLHCLAGTTEVSCGSEHNLAVVGGTCYSWGWNEHGMCGDGTEANVEAPKPVQALRRWPGLRVGCGAGHSLALCLLPTLPKLGPDSKDTGPTLGTAAEATPPETARAERETGGKDNLKLIPKDLPGADAGGL
ncbi:secretion-regulating guanine nucleotide exchange factor isoform X3 [Sorex fumeus]|uniref:secretion-regulating guanine nucleotide exchange factor isoform X3 n=1 Tax=Sorex fumeus TaxID=62283 RepID=UPI0024AD2950|nr:secretion-regulating guanine nucleotide exchange factor isoform X3 [Sorex fumeus]